MSKQTHYRTFSKSKHLSSEDLLGMDYLRVTIESVVTGKDENKRIKEPVPVARFKEKQIRQGEPLKTMILNMTNMKTIEDITGSPYLEDWANAEIEIYVASGIRLGNDLVDGLRIRKPPVQPMKKQLSNNLIDKLVNSLHTGSYTVDRLHGDFEVTHDQMTEINEKLEVLKNESQNQM